VLVAYFIQNVVVMGIGGPLGGVAHSVVDHVSSSGGICPDVGRREYCGHRGWCVLRITLDVGVEGEGDF
jgi:hypothetical protein